MSNERNVAFHFDFDSDKCIGRSPKTETQMMYKLSGYMGVFFLLILISVLMIFVSLGDLLQRSVETILRTLDPQAPPPQFTCLFHAHRAFDDLRVPWFITFGSALSYHRNRSFNTDDIDTGIFFHDTMSIGDRLVDSFERHGFRLVSSYGSLIDGGEWIFRCPSIFIKLDIFIFYPPLPTDSNSSSFRWWVASYNGLCNHIRYKKCRFKFSSFTLENITLRDTFFLISPQSLLIDQYGTDWKTPKTLTYFESLHVVPNLIKEYE